MSRKDYIYIADAMIIQINMGFVKKKYIGGFIAKMANELNNNNANFDYNRFETYIRNGVK